LLFNIRKCYDSKAIKEEEKMNIAFMAIVLIALSSIYLGLTGLVLARQPEIWKSWKRAIAIALQAAIALTAIGLAQFLL